MSGRGQYIRKLSDHAGLPTGGAPGRRPKIGVVFTHEQLAFIRQHARQKQTKMSTLVRKIVAAYIAGAASTTNYPGF